MNRFWKRLLCRVRGHASATDWYMPWRWEPMTNRQIDREILTVCNRCEATVYRRTVPADPTPFEFVP